MALSDSCNSIGGVLYITNSFQNKIHAPDDRFHAVIPTFDFQCFYKCLLRIHIKATTRVLHVLNACNVTQGIKPAEKKCG